VLSALILRLPDILQFIGLITIIGLMGFAMWTILQATARIKKRFGRK
jgi:hypothetical protein